MKRLLILVSLVLLSFFSLIDNQKEQPYLANIDRTLSLSCPDYLPPKLNLNETTDINKSEAATGNISTDWYSQAIKNIRQEEYNISYSEETGAFQSPNRANNILFTYHKSGFTAKTMQTKIPLFDVNDRSLSEKDKKYEELEEWSVELKIKNYELGIKNAELASEGNKACVENDKIRIDYVNSGEGMRQDFVIKENTSGEDGIELQMNVNTKMKMNVSKNAVTFFSKKDGTEKMHYSSLKAWDANDKILDSYFEERGEKDFAIMVDDKDAVYPVIIDPLSSTPDWIRGGFEYGDEFGFSVSDAGDLNLDGLSDVIIGSPGFSNAQSHVGKAYVYYGSNAGLSSNAGWTFECNVASAGFGYSVSGAGDVNGDNYPDIIIGAPYYSNGQTNEGRVYVFYGSNTGLSNTVSWTFESNKENAKVGYAVSKAGDFNHDGYGDIIIGAPGYGNDFFNAQGRVFIYMGSPAGPSSDHMIVFKNMLDGYTGLGSSVSYAGDVNDDGFSDVIFGEPYWPPPPSLGSASTLESPGRVRVAFGSPADILSSWTAEGEVNHSLFGYSVSGAGDVNNDGFSDIVIGSPNYHFTYCESSGKIYVYNGSAAGLSSSTDWTKDCSSMGYTNMTEGFGRSVSGADLNNDGYSDIIIGAHFTDWDNTGDTTWSAAYVYYSSQSGPDWEYGWYYKLPNIGSTHISVSGLQDVNGDGCSELIIGSESFNVFPTSSAKVFYGGYIITGLLPDWQAERESDIYQFGYSVSGGGDINNDGYDDVIIGAPVSDPNVQGKVWIYYGSPSGLPDHRQMYLQGTGGFGSAAAHAGDVNNDGFDDVIISAPNFNTGGLYGKVYLYLGTIGGLWYAPAWTCTSLGPGGYFGYSLSGAGDVNGDGFDDIIIGNNGNQLYNSHNVGAYIFCGSSSGITGNIPAWTISVSINDTINGFGRSVSGAGDVNGDSLDDVIVGSYPAEYENIGKAFVYFGQTNRAMFTPEDWSAEDDSLFGYSVSDAGDVNKDGFDDIIISSIVSNEFNGVVNLFKGSLDGPSITPDWSASGNVASLFGSSLSSAGDYNGDGYSDFVIGVYHGMNSYLFLGSHYLPSLTPDVNLRNSAMSVSSAGDVNGDGYDDVISGRGIWIWSYYGRPNSFHIYPKRSVVLVSQEYCANTVISSPSGKPMSGIDVYFILKGANQDSVVVITNFNGTAQYCYSGSNHGFDTIIARSGNLADTSIVFRDYPAPVELAFFTSSVSERNLTLSWTTSTELNNSGFEIEMSNIKGQTSNDWNKVGYIRGSGTSTDIHNYEFIQKNLNSGKYNYRLKQIDFNGNYEYFELAEEVIIGIPVKYNLSQNYPNPFNPVTTINYDLPYDGIVYIRIYDILGREMRSLVNEMKTAGYYKLQFNAADLSSGVYFYRMTAGDFVAVKKFVVLK